MSASSKPVTALDYLMHARRFQFSDTLLRRNYDPYVISVVSIPCIVLSSFASELYLKCLRMIENGHAPRGHNLKNLYKDLSSSTRRAISIKWDAHVEDRLSPTIKFLERNYGGNIDVGIENSLSMAARAFEEMRYPGEDSGQGYLIQDLPRLLDEVALSLKPEWVGVDFAQPKPLDSTNQ